MNLSHFFDGLINSQQVPALVFQDEIYTYGWLYERVNQLVKRFSGDIEAGSVVQLQADFSPNAVASLFALILSKAIVSLHTHVPKAKSNEYAETIQAERIIEIDANDQIHVTKTQYQANHTLIEQLRSLNHPGLIIFSSGTTGKSKAIIHDFFNFLKRIGHNKRPYRTIAFLLFDHIGGLNTLFQTFNNHGTLVIPDSRAPLCVSRAIEKHKVNALVTSPSFLNLLLLGQYSLQFDMSTLKIINYGSEAMPEVLLKRLISVFPHIRFSQAYGLSELGVLKVKSKSSDSLMIKIANDSIETRIRNDMLELKSHGSMLGYINDENPFTEDGWFMTGDKVEVDGEYLKILGRASDIINIGGEKVYPAEVENVLLELDEVEDVIVMSEPNAILGNIVKARLKIKGNQLTGELRSKIRSHCATRLSYSKIPQKFELIHQFTHSQRFKKIRKIHA